MIKSAIFYILLVKFCTQADERSVKNLTELYNGHFEDLNEIASRRFSRIEKLKNRHIDIIKKKIPAHIKLTDENVDATLLINATREIQLQYNETVQEHLECFLNNEKNFMAIFRLKLKTKDNWLFSPLHPKTESFSLKLIKCLDEEMLTEKNETIVKNYRETLGYLKTQSANLMSKHYKCMHESIISCLEMITNIFYKAGCLLDGIAFEKAIKNKQWLEKFYQNRHIPNIG